jgi:hypothetical protein
MAKAWLWAQDGWRRGRRAVITGCACPPGATHQRLLKAAPSQHDCNAYACAPSGEDVLNIRTRHGRLLLLRSAQLHSTLQLELTTDSAAGQLCVATASFLQHRPADPRSGSDGALFSEAHRAWRMLRPSTLQRTPWTSCDPFKRSRRDLLTSVPGVTCSVQVSVPTAAAVDESLH